MTDDKPVVNVRYNVFPSVEDVAGDTNLVFSGNVEVPLGVDVIGAVKAEFEKRHPGLSFGACVPTLIDNVTELRHRGCATLIKYAPLPASAPGVTYEWQSDEGYIENYVRPRCRRTLGDSCIPDVQSSHPTVYTVYDGTVKFMIVDARVERLAREEAADAARKAKEVEEAKTNVFSDFAKLLAQMAKLGLSRAAVDHNVAKAFGSSSSSSTQPQANSPKMPPELEYILPDILEHLEKKEKKYGHSISTYFGQSTQDARRLCEGFGNRISFLKLQPLPHGFDYELMELLRAVLSAVYNRKQHASKK